VPPATFPAAAVRFAVMVTAKRHREFVAHLCSKDFRLGEADVMGVRR
jgi:hypothetical protein